MWPDVCGYGHGFAVSAHWVAGDFASPRRATSLRRVDDDAIRTETEATITATLADGPLEGESIETEVIEGRPPKTIDVPVDNGSTCRYCLADWVQTGSSAVYTFLYRV